MKFVRVSIRWSLIVLAAVILSACTASSRVVKTYEGTALEPHQVAKLIAPEDIKIVEINGVAQKDYLLDNMSLTYDLVPGEYTVVYRYTGLWSVLRASDDNDEPRSEVVESELRQAKVFLEAGESYTFSFKRPDNREQAYEMAKTFQAVIVTGDGQSVAKDTRYVRPAGAPAPASAPSAFSSLIGATAAAVAPTPAPVSPGVSAAATAPAPAASTESGLSRLDALKVLWGKASADEKKEFLRWAFQ